jgi:replication factor C subunit 1
VALIRCRSPSASDIHLQFVHVVTIGFDNRWLGQNSKQTKLSRQLADVQVRMRLKVSGDKAEIRQTYVPSLFPYVVRPLMDEGAVSDNDSQKLNITHNSRQGAVDKVIERMDEYYLSKEDWETIVELGVGDNKDVKIATAAKNSFTRKYVSLTVFLLLLF